VGIFSVGIRPCALPAGIVGVLPIACWGVLPCKRRQTMAALPTCATNRAKISVKPI
jgi:hypothetical protein